MQPSSTGNVHVSQRPRPAHFTFPPQAALRLLREGVWASAFKMSPKGCHSGLLEGININRLFAMLKKYLLVMNKAYITMRVAASPDVDFEPIEPVCSLDAVFIA